MMRETERSSPSGSVRSSSSGTSATDSGGRLAGLIVWSALIQTLVPTELLGRVSSLDWFVSVSLIPASFASTGPIAAAIGAGGDADRSPRRGLPATLAFLFLPGIRDPEQPGRKPGSSL
jgi:hypothetical protein